MLTRMMGTDRRTDGQTQVTTITLRPKRPRVKKGSSWSTDNFSFKIWGWLGGIFLIHLGHVGGLGPHGVCIWGKIGSSIHMVPNSNKPFTRLDVDFLKFWSVGFLGTHFNSFLVAITLKLSHYIQIYNIFNPPIQILILMLIKELYAYRITF